MNSNHRIPQCAVIKIGTDSINEDVIRSLALQIHETRESISRLVLVSSGAVQYGRLDQGVSKTPDESVAQKKFFAAVGQPALMDAYRSAFKPHGISVAQALPTWADFDSRNRRSQLSTVLEQCFGAHRPTIAIFNENDVTADDEFRGFTDNDHLAREVAQLINAQMVLFLTTTNGLYRQLRDDTSRIATVQHGDRSWEQFVQSEGSANGKGGMRNKCNTAVALADQGIDTVIANAQVPRIVPRVLLHGESLGTHFVARAIR